MHRSNKPFEICSKNPCKSPSNGVQKKIITSQSEIYSEFNIDSEIQNKSDYQQLGSEKKSMRQNSKEVKKLIENCRRTARIILICNLSEAVRNKVHLEQELNQILSGFIKKPRRFEYLPEDNGCKNIRYYSSLNYSRIRICQKQFVDYIMKNQSFSEILAQLLEEKNTLLQTNLIRKNKRGRSLEDRKNIILSIFQDYQKILREILGCSKKSKKTQKAQKIQKAQKKCEKAKEPFQIDDELASANKKQAEFIKQEEPSIQHELNLTMPQQMMNAYFHQYWIWVHNFYLPTFSFKNQ